MTRYQAGLLHRFGYTPTHGCGKAQLCPALSLPDLFRGGSGPLDQAHIDSLLAAVPPYFSQSVITADRRSATLAFGIRLMSLDHQQSVIDTMRSALHPPAGVKAQLAGLPVVAAEANAQVSSQWRRLATLIAGLFAVAFALVVALRGARRALVPLIPILLAAGWAALALFIVRIPLNPMSVTLGAVVVAISTEFSVLIAERYRQERAGGLGVESALARTYSSTGAAVLASATTATAGFAVLIVSSISMLRDFGAAAVIDLVVAVVGVLVVLPTVLVLEERGELAQLPRRAVDAARRIVLRPGRAAAS
jgi:predicted RND superfamily exporter protein